MSINIGIDSISILIPALNEEKAIKETLRSIPFENVETVVIDNGSNDMTATFAEEEGAIVVEEPNRGYGYACLAGIRYLQSKENPPDYVIFLDADGTDDPREIIKLVHSVRQDNPPDLVMGSRMENSHITMSGHAIIANKIFAKMINLLYRTGIRDMGPLRIIKYDVLNNLEMKDTGYGWASEMIVKVLRKGYKIEEISINQKPRIGKSKISGSLFTSLKAAIWLTIHILRHSFTRK